MSYRKILVYGFRPYGTYMTNITESVILRLPHMPGVDSHVFDVRFDERMFEDYFTRIRPDIILGMGQHPRARKLRVERKCINAMKSPGGLRQPIEYSGPAARFANIDLPGNRYTTVSYDAGEYVCNYSMYMAGKYCSITGASFGFLHVPRNYCTDTLLEYLEATINTFKHRDKAVPG